MLRSLLKSFKPAEPRAPAGPRAPDVAHAPSAVPTPTISASAARPAATAHAAASPTIVQMRAALEQFNRITLAGTQARAVGEMRERLGRDARDFEALLILADLLREQAPEEALALRRQAAALRPNCAPLLYALAGALEETRRREEALECMRLVIASASEPLGPTGATDAHLRDYRFAYANLLFRHGLYREGFLQFRARREAGPDPKRPWLAQLPAWEGEPLEGRRILIWTDWGGLGDELQFARYIGMVRDTFRPAGIYLACSTQDQRLFGHIEGVGGAMNEGVLNVDCQAALLDLPCIFGTDLDTVPAPVPYLHPDPADRARWMQVLADKPGLKVGLCWASGVWQMGGEMDRARQMKSMPLEHLRELCAVPGASFISLQKGIGREQLAACGLPIHDYDEQLGDMADTAALASCLDLVITVDTSVSHLAGGLGCPTLVLMPHGSGNFWLTVTERSPWYPSVRLLRQSARGDWAGVAERAGALVREFASNGQVDVFSGLPPDTPAGR